MAVRENLTTDPLSNEQWSEGLEAEVLKKISYTHFIGKDSSSLIQWKDELINNAGDTVNIGLRMQDSGDLLGSTDTFETNESAITVHNDSFVINEVGIPYRWKTRMSRQRVRWEDREEAKAAISDRMAHGLDSGFFNQICSYNITSPSAVALTMSGNNAITASTNNIFPAGETVDEGLDSSGDNLTLDLISSAVELAKTRTPAIRPARVDGFGEVYVVFVHPYQMRQLKADGTRADEVLMAAIQGGRLNDNPLLTGGTFFWDGCLVVESNRVTQGVHSTTGAAVTTARRAVLCGAQAAVIGWGRTGGSPGSFNWVEESFDYDRERGVAASCLYGLKKLRFNSSDFGTILIHTYAVAS